MGVLLLATLVIAVLVIALPVHVLGHVVVARLMGARPIGIGLGAGPEAETTYPLGIKLIKRERPSWPYLELERDPAALSRPRQLALALSGPLASYLCAVLMFVALALSLPGGLRGTDLAVTAAKVPVATVPDLIYLLTDNTEQKAKQRVPAVTTEPNSTQRALLSWAFVANVTTLWLTLLAPFSRCDGGRLWRLLASSIGSLVLRRRWEVPDKAQRVIGGVLTYAFVFFWLGLILATVS